MGRQSGTERSTRTEGGAVADWARKTGAVRGRESDDEGRRRTCLEALKSQVANFVAMQETGMRFKAFRQLFNKVGREGL